MHMSEPVIDEEKLRLATEAVYALRGIPGHERRKTREDAGVSRKVLGDQLGISAETVRGYENGSTPHGLEAHLYYRALTAMTPPSIEPELTPEARANLDEYFRNGETCAHCKGVHVRACPRVKRMSYHESGALASVEFWPEGKWSTDNVVFPDSPEMSE